MKKRLSVLALGLTVLLLTASGASLAADEPAPIDVSEAESFAPSLTAAAGSVGGCTVSPHRPYVSGGWAYASIYVTCSVSRTVIGNAYIKEQDIGSDDDVSSLWSGSVTVGAGETRKIGTVSGRCRNFDLVGAEELYTVARINVVNINSSWVSTQTVSVSC